MMRTMKIFEPSMCCSTGLCGVSFDPELLRISTIIETLKKNGIEVGRYNLSNAPQAFLEEEAVQRFMKQFGPQKLPVTTVDGFVVITGRYPTNEEFTDWLDINPDLLSASETGNVVEENDTSCCCCDSCC